MRGDIWRGQVEAAIGGGLAEQRADREHLHGLIEMQRRQDAGNPLGEHCLAAARRAREEEVVTAGGSHLHRDPGLRLASNLRKVRHGAPGQCPARR